jgi:hypothetical protein
MTWDWVYGSNPMALIPHYALAQPAIVSALSNAIRTLMKLPNLKEMVLWQDEGIHLLAVLSKTLNEEYEAGRKIQYLSIPYKKGESGRLRWSIDSDDEPDAEQGLIQLLW